jgi:hypothetical protein
MIRMTQHKWLLVAVCLCLGGPTSFAGDSAIQKWIQNMVKDDPRYKEAKTNCDAYSKLINYSNDEVNKLAEQDAKNLDDSGAANAEANATDKAQAIAIRQQHLAALWKTQTNINTLLSIAQQSRDAALLYAIAHPGDSFDARKAKADAEGLTNDYNNLVKWANNNADRIWRNTDNLRGQDTDSGTDYPDAPNKIERAPLPALPKDSGADAEDHPWKGDPRVKAAADAQDVIADLFGEGVGFGPGTTSLDQGDKATKEFIDAATGNSDSGGAKTANRDGAWEHAKDAAQDAIDAARNAANTARDSATSATDNCKDHSMGGHP